MFDSCLTVGIMAQIYYSLLWQWVSTILLPFFKEHSIHLMCFLFWWVGISNPHPGSRNNFVKKAPVNQKPVIQREWLIFKQFWSYVIWTIHQITSVILNLIFKLNCCPKPNINTFIVCTWYLDINRFLM